MTDLSIVSTIYVLDIFPFLKKATSSDRFVLNSEIRILPIHQDKHVVQVQEIQVMKIN